MLPELVRFDGQSVISQPISLTHPNRNTMLLIPGMHIAEISFFETIDSIAKSKTHVFMEGYDLDDFGPNAHLFENNELAHYYRNIASIMSKLRNTFLGEVTNPLVYHFDHYKPKSNWFPIEPFYYEDKHLPEIRQLEEISSQQNINPQSMTQKAISFYLSLTKPSKDSEVLPLIKESLEICLFQTIEKIPFLNIKKGLTNYGSLHIPQIFRYLSNLGYQLDKIQPTPVTVIEYPIGFIPWLEHQLTQHSQY